jgi:2-dehydro-3-deoxy-D-gluconate 5-dehydrogenase
LNLFELAGRAAVVTGGNGGIGLAIAKALALSGAKVMIAGRNPAKTEASVKSIAAAGGACVGLELDVSDPAACNSLSEQVLASLGGCDILVNCAGINVRAAASEVRLDDWHAIIAVNLTATLLCSQSIYPIMREQRGGKIICVGSMYSLFGAPMVAGYAASKGGVVQLAKSLATAWAPDNIQVNTILPGWIDTDLTERARQDVPGLNENVLSRTPAGRWGMPEDVAGAALFLASSASDFVTGISLPVDGGYSVRG